MEGACARPPPNAPNSADTKSSACAGRAAAPNDAATPKATQVPDLLPDLRFMFGSGTRFTLSTATTSKGSSPDGPRATSSQRDALALLPDEPGSLRELPAPWLRGAANSSAAPPPWCRH